MNGEERVLLASAARTATVNSGVQHPEGARGGHFVIDVTASTATPSVVPKVQGYDPVSDTWYDILEGVAVTGTGTTVLRVYPGLAASANTIADDILPPTFRVLMTHADTDSITYSVVALLVG